MECVEKEVEKKDLMVKKLKNGFFVGKRATPSTPSPTWRLHLLPNSSSSSSFSLFSSFYTNGNNKKDSIQEFLTISSNRPTVSVRMLCANLWATQSQWYPLSTMPKRLHDQPSSANSTKSHIGTSHVKYHQTIKRNGRVVQPVSPTSYGSSIEVTPFQPTIGRKTRKSSYSPKTSTEVLKVLNRILSLKEQQEMSKATLVKSLTLELYRCYAQIKKLGRDNAIVRLITKELQDERMLRRNSENLNRKLAREVTKAKSLYSNTFRELRSEIESRNVIENLCDEFAKGIQHYEQEVGLLAHESEIDRTWAKRPDRLILDISKSWLEMRVRRGKMDMMNCFSLNTRKRFDENMDKSDSKCLDDQVTKIINRATEKVETRRLSSGFLLDKLTQNKPMSSDRDRKTEDEYSLKVGCRLKPIFAGRASRVQQRMLKPMSEDCTKSRLSRRLPRNIKENSLHAKLLEARSQVTRSNFSKS